MGKLLAELVVEGAARSVDIGSLSLERFATGEVISEGHVV